MSTEQENIRLVYGVGNYGYGAKVGNFEFSTDPCIEDDGAEFYVSFPLKEMGEKEGLRRGKKIVELLVEEMKSTARYDIGPLKEYTKHKDAISVSMDCKPVSSTGQPLNFTDASIDQFLGDLHTAFDKHAPAIRDLCNPAPALSLKEIESVLLGAVDIIDPAAARALVDRFKQSVPDRNS